MTTLSTYEVFDLQEAIMERMGDALLPALTKANRSGDLRQLLDLLGMSDLIDESGSPDFTPTRILVIGESTIKEGQLRSIARKHGFDVGDLEFALGYNELKHYNFDKLRNTFVYKAVLAGPMPHSTPGKRSASSMIAEMENHPESYPPVITLRDSTGLKITRNSFTRALEELAFMG